MLFICVTVFGVAGQTAAEKAAIEAAGSGSGWWVLLIVVYVLGGAAYFWYKSEKGKEQPESNQDNSYNDYYSTNDSYDMEGVDAEKELEWFRKAKKSRAARQPKASSRKKKARGSKAKSAYAANPVGVNDPNFSTQAFQEKMRRMQYDQLPINSFAELSPSKLYDPLPISDDPSLLNAIDQVNEEFEEDETVRDLAVRILMAFRNRNSVEALAQVALYDLSSNIRSKAVSILTDFDHPSVFEAIILACADPTREVRAAAARGLFKLNFDRADAWKRIVETNDEFRMSQAARAAIESDIVSNSLDRLLHEDLKVAYEAFALVCLLIKSGETDDIFDAILNHRDVRVRFALLHILKMQGDTRALDALSNLQKTGSLPDDIAERVKDTIASFESVTG